MSAAQTGVYDWRPLVALAAIAAFLSGHFLQASDPTTVRSIPYLEMLAMYVNCDKCGGKIVLTRVGTVPEELSVTGATTLGITSVKARVCVGCGYIAL